MPKNRPSKIIIDTNLWISFIISNKLFLLELAKDSKADYILTGDKDLLAIAKFGKTKIMTVTSFLESRNKI